MLHIRRARLPSITPRRAGVCQEAGARVGRNVALANIDVPVYDARRIEVVCNGLPFGKAHNRQPGDLRFLFWFRFPLWFVIFGSHGFGSFRPVPRFTVRFLPFLQCGEEND